MEIRRVAVIGGSGKVGKHIVDQAVLSGYDVYVLTRQPKTDIRSQVHYITGDVRRKEDLRTLLGNCDAVINTIGPSKESDRFFTETTSSILSVMKELGIKRYITVSGGALTLRGDEKRLVNRLAAFLFNLCFPKMLRDKEQEFAVLSQSNVDWTLVRLPMIKDRKVVGDIIESEVDMPGTSINNRDIASFLVKQLIETRYYLKAPFISN